MEHFLTHDSSTVLITKPDKNITRKENYIPKCLMKIDAKILNKILANKINIILKGLFIMTKWGLFQEFKGGST